MSFSVIVTVGPALFSEEKIKKINTLGDCIFRINGAHANAEQARDIANMIRNSVPDARVMIDLPGNKIRTANFTEPIRLIKGESIALRESQVNFSEFHKYLKKGDIVLANDSLYTLEIEKIENSVIYIKSYSDGLLQTNKGLHVQGIHQDIPFLFSRDIELIELACEIDLDIISLSFVRNKEDVKTVKKILEKHSSNSAIFAKIETKSAVENLETILEEVEYINIDRGDLSTDVGLIELPAIINTIVETGIKNKKEVFLATQFLKNMEEKSVPLISEIDDLYRSLLMGISGIQLSEETAVGKYPKECVKLVFDMYKEINN